MNKLILACFFLIISASSSKTFAQGEKEQNSPGIFNSLAVGISAGLTGIGVDVASPIGSYLAVRAGISIMPNFNYSDEVDVDIDMTDYPGPNSMNVEGGMKRTSGELLLNVYPFKRSSFFVCGGAYFGGSKIIKITGHSDELAQLIKDGEKAGIEIGDYSIPVDENGNVAGGLKVASFRPYLGLGFGRAVPHKRVGFMFELGVQFHKTPKVYADNANLTQLNEMADNEFSDIIDKLTIYPVLKFRLCGRIF